MNIASQFRALGFARDNLEEPADEPIIIEDDEEDTAGLIGSEDHVIEIDDGNDDLTILTQEEVHRLQRRRTGLPAGHRYKESVITSNGLRIKPKAGIKRKDGNYFRVKHIVQDPNGSINLLGHILLRPQDVERKISALTGETLARPVAPQQVNELCVVLKTGEGQLGTLLEHQNLDSMPLHEVGSVHEMIYTNMEFPNHSYMELGLSVKVHDKSWIESVAPLVCRWVYVEEIKVEKRRRVAMQISNLSFDEADEGARISDVVRSRNFRIGQEKPGGGKKKKVYTVGDICAGCGCVSRAARNLGLTLKWAVDKWVVACTSYYLNFPTAEIDHMEVNEFVQELKAGPEFRQAHMVDIIHMSFPCQGHSRMNRGQNPDRDAVNNAVLYALQDILTLLKPRRVTLEQTDHIIGTNEGQHGRMLFNQFTSAGYSVRSMVLNALDYGVAQNRKRLIMFAACPGETLAARPTPTHGYSPGLKTPLTVKAALSPLDPEATHHDVAARRAKQQSRPRRLPVADGDKPLQAIIKTAGVEALHPDGDRWFTIREQMKLQGLPDDHQLYGETQGDLTEQIGNGVPVPLGEAILKEVIKSLEEDDARAAAWDMPVTIDD